MLKKLLKVQCLLLLLLICVVATSCSSKGKLSTIGVAYQSVRTDNYRGKIPQDAKIAVLYSISKEGRITPIVVNKTDEIMIIDQTMSFFVDITGTSRSYYDPTVKTTSTTDISSETKGASINLGAIGSAFGIGGPLGTALGGINVGGSGTSGTSTTNTTYFADQPRISLSPRSQGAMSKSFKISKVGFERSYTELSLNSWLISNVSTQNIQNVTPKPEYSNFSASCRKESPLQFSVCISYSLDNGETFDKIVTDFYVNTQMIEYVKEKGKVNDALRQIYINKPDAINETWWVLHFLHTIPAKGNIYDTETQGLLFDYR